METEDKIKELISLMLDISTIKDYKIYDNELFYNSCSIVEANYVLGNGNYEGRINLYELGNMFVKLLKDK